MKLLDTTAIATNGIPTPIKVLGNKATNPNWMQIQMRSNSVVYNGRVLHTGRPKHIRNIAKKRYGILVH